MEVVDAKMDYNLFSNLIDVSHVKINMDLYQFGLMEYVSVQMVQKWGLMEFVLTALNLIKNLSEMEKEVVTV